MEYENVTAKYKDAIIKGMRWGMWLGGIVTIIIFGVLKLIFSL